MSSKISLLNSVFLVRVVARPISVFTRPRVHAVSVAIKITIMI